MLKSFNSLAIFAVLWLFASSCVHEDIVFTDPDGNVTRTVEIGSQVWMAENLKTTKYDDGTPIPYVSDSAAWSNLSTPGYCFYNNDVANKNKYGILYNWYAINTGKLAPKGWHVATDADWTTLKENRINFGYNYDGSYEGNKFGKSLADTAYWTLCTDRGAIGNDLTNNNSSGFSARPGGYRSHIGAFEDVGSVGFWWSSTQSSATSAYYRNLYYNFYGLDGTNNPKRFGYSVRCVLD